jgi:hypothetical protein
MLLVQCIKVAESRDPKLKTTYEYETMMAAAVKYNHTKTREELFQK